MYIYMETGRACFGQDQLTIVQLTIAVSPSGTDGQFRQIGACRDDGKQYLPPGGRCPEGADEEWRNLEIPAVVGITVQHLDEFRKSGQLGNLRRSPFLIHRCAVPLLNCGMIATGNPYNSDSLRDAPPPGEGIISPTSLHTPIYRFGALSRFAQFEIFATPAPRVETGCDVGTGGNCQLSIVNCFSSRSRSAWLRRR